MNAATLTWFDDRELAHSASNRASAAWTSDDRATSVAVRDEWTQVFKRLEEFEDLESDWDGLGASTPHRESIEGARALLNAVRADCPNTPPKHVLAAPDGAVVLEWQSDGMRLEVEIDDLNEANFVLENSGRAPQFWTAPMPTRGPSPITSSRDALWETARQHSPTSL